MKQKTLPIALLAVVAIALSGCSALAPAGGEQPSRTMNVTGTGTVELSPDIAYANIGVRSQSPDISVALKENSAAAEAIIQRLMDLGIESKDIQTRNFNVYPQQEQRPGPEGEFEETQIFVVENTVSITLRDLESLGEALSAAIQEGANTIHGVSFDVEDRESAIAEARRQAIQDAESQAQDLAEAAGVSLGPIHSISINQDGGPIPVERSVAMEAPQGGGAVPISGGQLTIRVTANLTYAIE